MPGFSLFVIFLFVMIVLGKAWGAAVVFALFGLYQLWLSYVAFQKLEPKMKKVALDNLFVFRQPSGPIRGVDIVEDSRMRREVLSTFWIGIMGIFTSVALILILR